MSLRFYKAKSRPAISIHIQHALSEAVSIKHLIMMTLALLILIPPTARVHSEPVKKVKQGSSLSSSLNNRLKKVKLGSGSRSRIYKNIPFEPLTDNRLSVSEKSHLQSPLMVHTGNNWIEFVIVKDDTLYSLVRKFGLSIKDLYTIMHVGVETSGLKLLKPGQKLRIHALDKNILEIIHHQSSSRKLHVKKVNNAYSGITTVNGLKVKVVEPPKNRALFARSHHYPVLRNRSDKKLQNNLEKTIQHLGLMSEIKKRKLAVALVDITNIKDPKLAMLNGDEMMYAASLPKIAILLGAFVEIEQGNMALDSETRDSLTQMIRFSSNENATKMLSRVGNHRLQEILMSDRYKLYDPIQNGGLWVGKAYGKTPAFERDPLHNLSHGATVLQAARFYYLMETGRLVSSKLTADMKEILSEPKINHKFVKGLTSRPEATIYRKSGSWRQWHADSALIEANGYKYIAVALAEDPKGGQWLAEMIAPLHDLIVPQNYAELAH